MENSSKSNRFYIIARLVLAFVAVILLFIAGMSYAPTPNKVDIKPVTRNIFNKEKVIEHHTKEVANNTEIARMLKNMKKELLLELEAAKLARDTFQIVQIQDTVINHQEKELGVKDSIISHQQDIIVAQRYIINGKDTIIAVLEQDKKKLKRQRNIAIVSTIVAGGIAILK